MFHDIIFLLLGLILIIAGGSYVTDGAECVARKFKVSTLIIGLTVVAFGSSTPDLVVCLMASLTHKSQMAIGDVVGANIFDILLVTGIVAMVVPIKAEAQMRRIDIPMLAIASLALFFVGDTAFFDRGLVHPDIIHRSDGLMLILLFAIYMAMNIYAGRSQQAVPAAASTSAAASEDAETPTPWDKITGKVNSAISKAEYKLRIHPHRKTPDKRTGKINIWMAVVLIIGGLAALVIGGNWIVDGASGIARKAGMSQALVGLTIVAIGSSLPDLATSLIAALKGQPGLALGNVVGACIFNALFIIGLCSSISPMQTSDITLPDFGALALGAILLWIFACAGKTKQITFGKGLIFALLWVAYMVYLIIFKS